MSDRRRRGRGLLAALALCLAGGVAPALYAQDAARPTGTYVLAQLDAARQALATRAARHPELGLQATAQRLAQMGEALRRELGGASAQPVEIMGDKPKSAAELANAAALRTQAYLKAADDCRGDDAKALAQALALNVDKLAATPASGKAMAPVIDALETPDSKPLFVVQQAAAPLAFVVTGQHLLDPQCANPQVSLTDAQGQPLAVQPTLTAAAPQRLAFTLDRARLSPGGYVLHVVPQRKVFLMGCSKQPEAVITLQVTAPPRIVVDYTLEASCAGKVVPLAHGSLPALERRGATVSLPVDVSACPNAQSYTVAATAHYGDGDQVKAGPITQPADAGITTGLPGGVSLSWSPSIHTLVARSGAGVCPAVN